MREEISIAKIKEELQQGNLKTANRLLYRIMFSRESHKLLADRLEDEHVTASIVMAFVRSISFSKSVKTVEVTLKKHQVRISPDFFVEYVEDLEDLFWVLLHERGHLILRILGYGELCNDIHNELGFNRGNFIEDVFINAVSRQHIRSKFPERYYGKASPVNKLLSADIGDPTQFPYEVVLIHSALYGVNCKKLLKELGISLPFAKLSGKYNDEYYFNLTNKYGLHKLNVSLYGAGGSGTYTERQKTVRADFPTLAKVLVAYFRREGLEAEKKIMVPIVGPPSKSSSEGEEGGEGGETCGSEERDELEADVVQGSDVKIEEGETEGTGKEKYEADTDELDYQTGGEQMSSKDVKSYQNKRHSDVIMKKAGNGRDLWGYRFPELADPKSIEFKILYSLTQSERKSLGKEIDTFVRATKAINLQKVGEIAGSILTNFVTEEALVFNSPTMPTRLSRKDTVWLGAGHTPIMYEHQYSVTEEPYVIYLDVSGSMDRWMWIIPQLVSSLQQIIAQIFHFSNELVEVDPDSQYYFTTGGTDYDIVAKHIISNEFKRVVIVTDETASIRTDLREQLREQCEDLVLICTGKSFRTSGFKSVATKSVTMENN